MNDRRYPWLILVPRGENLREIVDLEIAARAALIEEIAAASRFVQGLPGVEKINVGALGNIVGQLHVHVIGRAAGDPAWPGPVWGFGKAERYDESSARALVEDASLRPGDQARRGGLMTAACAAAPSTSSRTAA